MIKPNTIDSKRKTQVVSGKSIESNNEFESKSVESND